MRITKHFKDRVDERLADIAELDQFGYKALASAILDSTEEINLSSGDSYRIARLNGVIFGIGYSLNNNELIITSAFDEGIINADLAKGINPKDVPAFN